MLSVNQKAPTGSYEPAGALSDLQCNGGWHQTAPGPSTATRVPPTAYACACAFSMAARISWAQAAFTTGV